MKSGVPGAAEEGMGSYLLMGIEFQFCKMKRSGDWVHNNMNILSPEPVCLIFNLPVLEFLVTLLTKSCTTTSAPVLGLHCYCRLKRHELRRGRTRKVGLSLAGPRDLAHSHKNQAFTLIRVVNSDQSHPLWNS